MVGVRRRQRQVLWITSTFVILDCQCQLDILATEANNAEEFMEYDA